MQSDQGVPQARRIDLPAPVALVHIGVVHRIGETAVQAGCGAPPPLGPDRIGHIVAEAKVVGPPLRQDCFIPRFHGDPAALPLPLPPGKGRIVPPDLNVREIKPLVHALHGRHHIVRMTGVGVHGHKGAHASDLEFRIDLMARPDRGGAGHKLVVDRLVHGLPGALQLRKADSGAGPAEQVQAGVALVVDLIEGHPVPDLVLVPLHHRGGIADKALQRVPAQPAAVVPGQVIGHLKVGEGDHRLNVIFEQLVKERVIKPQARLIGLGVVAVWKNAGPGDGGAEALEAELRQKGNVLPKGVVEIDPLVVGVPLSRQRAVCDAAQHAGTAAGEDVGHADALSVLIPGPLQLSGAHRAAP